MRTAVNITMLLILLISGVGFCSDMWDPLVDEEEGVAKGLVLVINYQIGSRSEGPRYLLQIDERSYLVIAKDANAWSSDENLERFVRKFVEIRGEIKDWVDFKDYEPFLNDLRLMGVMVGWIYPEEIEELEGVECFHMIDD